MTWTMGHTGSGQRGGLVEGLRRMMSAPALSSRFRTAVWLGMLVYVLIEALSVALSVEESDSKILGEGLAVSLVVLLVSLRVTWGTLVAFVMAMLTIPFWDPNSYPVAMILIAMMVARTVNRSFGILAAIMYLTWSVSSAIYTGLHPVNVAAADILVAVGALIGWALRLQSRRLARIEQDLALQETLGQQAVEVERRRIATELHDVVAHGLTIIAMQSSVLEMAREEEVRTAAQRNIGGAARQSLLDLRRMLFVLHGSDRVYEVDDEDMTASLTTRAQEYTASLQAAGFIVENQVHETPGLARSLRLTLIRILQECTTNILKHAQTPARACFAVHTKDQSINLTVRNQLPTARLRTTLPVSGFGMIGMQERVALFDGTLSYGPEGGDWVVRVSFPQRHV
ncbi:hypothetical protein E8P82_14655 [Arthrobacter echini]|uniref:histidine kinase n=1 Tax=Arthrobacter echini TaxID=1529066 RepID=A0A4V3Z4Z6_9MICC|nr:histidine kinase [Arthrobacter echini]THJ64609.1 hypothetical protein E8P82_14655 [Arthrobacter echini]